MKKGIQIGIFLCLIIGLGVPCLASYYEDWIIEAKVLEVYDEKTTAKFLKENPEIQVMSKNFAGMKIKLTKCEIKEGHGKNKCQEGQERVIVMDFDPKKVKPPFTKDMVLRMLYYYSDSAVPPGHPSSSNAWRLVELKHNKAAP